MFDISKVMISLKFTYNIKPQKLELNDLSFGKGQGIMSPCESAGFGNLSILPKNYKYLFIAQVKGAVFYRLAT